MLGHLMHHPASRVVVLAVLVLSFAACEAWLPGRTEVRCGDVPADLCPRIADLALGEGPNAPVPPIRALSISAVECEDGRGWRRVRAEVAPGVFCWALQASLTDGRAFGMVYERLDGSLGVVWD